MDENSADIQSVRKNLIESLDGTHPKGELKNPYRELAELCITLGNVLVWISDSLEKSAGTRFPHLRENQPTCKDIGQRFREAGLFYWDRKMPSNDVGTEVTEIRGKMAAMEQNITAILLQIQKVGGAK